MAGTLLSIKPVLSVSEGEVVVIGKARGSKNGYDMLDEFIDQNGGIDFGMPFCLGYTGTDNSLLNKYIEDSEKLWKGKTDTLPQTIIGSTIGVHAGPGAIAKGT
jgi:fatty acid-binding protein DegV